MPSAPENAEEQACRFELPDVNAGEALPFRPVCSMRPRTENVMDVMAGGEHPASVPERL